MDKYERLTERVNKGQVKFILKDGENPIEKFQNALNRLAELEDKIEQGTLIELPCKVGDTVYRITQSYRDGIKVTTYTVKEIIIDKKGVSYLAIALKGASSIVSKAKLNSVFLTREEAEKRLKELQE